jgi:hypothetical protein
MIVAPSGAVGPCSRGIRACLSLALLSLAVWPMAGMSDDARAQTGADEQGTPVALELVLAVDASTSISDAEFALQRDGLSAAFRDPDVCRAIEHGGSDGIAVALIQWSNSNDQVLAVPWTHLSGAADCRFLAERIGAMRRSLVGGTVISGALHFARAQIEENRFAGRRKVIDIVADGPDRHGVEPARARDRAVAAGITVNALAIMTGQHRLDEYLRNNIAGGPDAFVMTANGFGDFSAAIRIKLIRELVGPSLAGPERLKVTAPRYTGTSACYARAQAEVHACSWKKRL